MGVSHERIWWVFIFFFLSFYGFNSIFVCTRFRFHWIRRNEVVIYEVRAIKKRPRQKKKERWAERDRERAKSLCLYLNHKYAPKETCSNRTICVCALWHRWNGYGCVLYTLVCINTILKEKNTFSISLSVCSNCNFSSFSTTSLSLWDFAFSWGAVDLLKIYRLFLFRSIYAICISIEPYTRYIHNSIHICMYNERCTNGTQARIKGKKTLHLLLSVSFYLHSHTSGECWMFVDHRQHSRLPSYQCKNSLPISNRCVLHHRI